MQIDPRLNDIDDCLYRVAVRALIIQNDKILLVQEKLEGWWALPGGGVDHGETLELCLTREIEEELGVPAKDIAYDSQIAYYNIGSVVNGVPRMNLFYKVSLPEEVINETSHVAKWAWFTKDEFLKLNVHFSFDKTQLVGVIFGDS